MRNHQKGQIMLEAIVALTLMTVGMLGLFGILSSSISASRTSTNKEIAVNLAAEGIEVVKSMLDKNFVDGVAWNAGLTSCGSGCSVQFDTTCPGSTVLGSTCPQSNLQNNFLKYNSGASGPTAGTYNYTVGNDTIFKRRITINGFGSPIREERVVSTVTWLDKNSVPFSVVLEDRFFNWR